MTRPDVRGGTYLVLGLARSGCAAGALLRRHGAAVIGYDDAPESELRAGWVARDLAVLAGKAFDEVRAGGAWGDLDTRRLAGVVLSPGFPPDHPRLAGLRERAEVRGELEWAARFCGARLIGITGTNGKTTTTELTAHLARAAGWRAEALGNVGRPLSLVADTLGADDVAVLELSSFQLETVETFRPAVAVVLNLEPDHLDRYPDVAAYYRTKRRLVEALPPNGWFVTWTGCREARGWRPDGPTLLFGARADGARVWADAAELGLDWDGAARRLCEPSALRLRGAPNLLNACAAVAALLPLGADPAALAAGLPGFAGLPHRQRTVARLGDVDFVDDSKATNVAAVTAGLAGYGSAVVLIVGGRGKGEDYAPLRAALGPVRAVVAIGEEGPAIAATLAGLVPVTPAATLEAAVATAARLAAPRGTVLLSPACASYDMFRDYVDRGERFAAAARALGAVAGEDT